MILAKYLADLSLQKKEVLLGKTTNDALHSAFNGKRVVHAGLLGEPMRQEEQQVKYYESLLKKADKKRKHAVYIHIPFCQTRCLYCGFYQNASRQEVEDGYLQQLLEEIAAEASSPQLQGTTIDAVFIGGGTPTSLSPANAARLLQMVQESFTLAKDCEVTLEGRIQDLVPEKIETWLQHGVNRISLGVQSFSTSLRQRIGRIDDREEVLQRLKCLKRYDVTVIVDLIYGLPGQTMEMWLDDIKTLAEVDVDGMDLYQLNIFPEGPLDKAVKNGLVPACADIGGQADMYVAARDFLLEQGVERLSLCHWRRHKRERSLYNTLAKSGADVYAFGCGAGGHFGGITWMNQRTLEAYQADRLQGKKPLLMIAHQVEEDLGQVCDELIRNLEMGFVDLRSLMLRDRRLEEMEIVLQLWQQRGLMQADLGIYRLTKAGEFWYISLTQSLVECAQVILAPEQLEAPTEELAGAHSDALDELLAEILPDSTVEKRAKLMDRIPMAVRMMLRRSSKESLKSMIAGMPPAMWDKMLQRAAN